jgi:hypothetical protein
MYEGLQVDLLRWCVLIDKPANCTLTANSSPTALSPRPLSTPISYQKGETCIPMTINTVFSILLTLLMDMNAWFVLAKVSFPDEQLAELASPTCQTPRSALAHFFRCQTCFIECLRRQTASHTTWLTPEWARLSSGGWWLGLTRLADDPRLLSTAPDRRQNGLIQRPNPNKKR